MERQKVYFYFNQTLALEYFHSVGGVDYIPLSQPLALQGMRLCVNITIVDDLVLEDDKAFHVQLASDAVSILLGLDTTTVTISNDDSELCLLIITYEDYI